MAQVVLSEVGAAVGRWALPQGLQVLGQTVAGATIGRAIGSVAGRAIDAAFAGATEGPRVKGLHVMEAREGAGIPGVYGKMRVGGQVIWAARFREAKTTRSTGGKGGPKVSDFSYSVSFAVALGEGPILGVQRAWANGEAFDLSGVVYRIHTGTEDQAPDPLIEMVEGAAPAYRGVAYIVFEDLPLDDFGNRLPQLSFEVARVPGGGSEAGLGEVVTGVNVIPASGEFVYATEIVRERLAPGRERALNANSGEARADFLVSLDQLERDLPRVDRAALTVGWFGDSLAAGDCAIRPGVEVAERVTVPMAWSVDGVGREGAYLISRDEGGNANYGGTPADACVVQAIEEMKARGIAVTLSPFLFMDCEGLPWRGRVTVSADGTAAAREEIEAFVEGEWGFRRFILHHADLALAAGGVEAFLIGSEMRGLTRVRDEAGAFPFVEKLISIAADVKAILPSAKVSYAADWTEYGAYVPGDGSGDVLFPLDTLWADENVDYVAVDWYPPMGDWRSGAGHLDAVAGYAAADDADYLSAQLAGGEAYDWYYASEADRDAQVRTPISDTAHGEHWVFRAKDLSGWAGALHYPRPGGVRAAAPTGWVPGTKPVRLSEVGFAAVDKGGNAPNLFFDPKSSESALPPYSTGARDDVFQKRALAVTLAHFEDDPLVEATFVWAWEGRPFPAWPVRDGVWGDGGNWARGHWLNGRAGLAPLADVVADICARGGVSDVDVRELDGVVEGYGLDGVHSVRAALEPLKAAFGFECVERDGALVFRMQGEGAVLDVATADLIEGGLQRTRRLVDKAPERLRLTYVDLENDYQPGVTEARVEGGDPRLSVDVSLPLAMGAGRAEAVARFLLDAAASAETAEAGLVLNGLALEPGDGLRVDGGVVWRVIDVTDAGIVRGLALVADVEGPGIVRGLEPGPVAPPAPDFGAVDLVVIDGPRLPGETDVTGPLMAAWADPWPGTVRVLAGLTADAMSERVVLSRPAVIGRLVAAVDARPVGRWDRANKLRVYAPGGDFASLPEAQVLGGGNALLLETAAGWELVQFTGAELVGVDTWVLSRLLRGQEGSESAAADEGARVVLVDGALLRARVSPGEVGLALDWRAAGDEAAQAFAFEDKGGLPWRVAHLRRRGDALDWVRRGADVATSWAFPEAANAGRFAVEVDTGSGFGGRFEVAVPSATLAPGVASARVAEAGADGRVGPWVSIGAGTS
ncbi:baseplate multidomain protein megatron [Hyphomonas oceanitis]|uniref:Gene transfer agent-like protein n=1 Tax=Hyphomonas oceanitis SCH89 TaxID=1280953 RepID=A0A059G8G5_9PROT|nr:glycoside hydrolase/phage tail family protein [Hyphomonas oceanitis]KDA02855.1 gene transfer agent-like protein [Hyphomonas oceanitis SCH89]